MKCVQVFQRSKTNIMYALYIELLLQDKLDVRKNVIIEINSP